MIRLNRELTTLLLAVTLILPDGVQGAQNSSSQIATERKPITLQEFENMALEKNPTLAQAEANKKAAQGKALQAGLYPNPSIGFTADEVSRGPIIRGGEAGVFVQQEIVLGGKLNKDRRTLEQDVVRAEAQAQAQRLRVLTTVRQLFYQALAAERSVSVRTQLLSLTREAVTTSRQLQNVGQADQPDILEIEIDQERAELTLVEAQNDQSRIWKQLAAAVGDVTLKLSPLAGNIEQVPELDMDDALSTLLRDSPEIKLAQVGTVRAEAALDRARAEKIPNIDIRGGLKNNRELLESGGRPVGLEGFVDVGVRIPIFDRNQGGVASAGAELLTAQREIDRVNLSLRTRFATAYKDYVDAREASDRYRTGMIPRAQRAYDLYMVSFRQMAAAYPQALIARRTLFQLQDEYSKHLARVWNSALEIQGLLLSGGLDSPGNGDSRPPEPTRGGTK